MELYDELYDLCGMVEEELNSANKKLKSAGKLTGEDLTYIDKLTHTLKSIKTTMAMMDAEGGSYADGMMRHYGSYARGRRRDSMGRYASRMGRSYNDGFVEDLKELMNNAPDDHTRQKLHNIISEMNQ
jgi:hypothetical protein